MEFNIQQSVSKFTASKSCFSKPFSRLKLVQYSEWVDGPDRSLILDFEMLLSPIPPWISAYSTAETPFLHRIKMTMKVKGSQSEYNNFTGKILKTLTAMQCRSLEKVFFLFFFEKILLDWLFSIFQHCPGSPFLDWPIDSSVSNLQRSYINKWLILNAAHIRLLKPLISVKLLSAAFLLVIWRDWKMTINGCRIHMWLWVFGELI